MKAIVKYEKPGSYEVVENPVPEIKSGEVLIKVRVTGICHTDVSILENRYKGKKPVPIPVIMGHEGAGEIAEIKDTKRFFEVGQRVGFEALNGCGKCYFGIRRKKRIIRVLYSFKMGVLTALRLLNNPNKIASLRYTTGWSCRAIG